MNKFVTKDYLLTQFKNYDREVAEPRSSEVTIDVDNALSSTSENPVQNKVVKAALDGKQASLTFDSAPTENSTNPVTSGGVYSAIQTSGSSYTLPTATTSTLGGVKVDGSTINIDSNGVISSSSGTEVEANPSGTASAGDLTKLKVGSSIYNVPDTVYTLPTASTSTLGGVKVDGTTVTINNGVISSVGGSGGSSSGGLIPKMTSNTAPSGTVTANVDSTNAWKVFDGDDSTYLDVRSVSDSPYITYHFDSPVKVSRVLIKFDDNNSLSKTDIHIKGSNDGSNWSYIGTNNDEHYVTLDSYDNIFCSNFSQTYEYSYYYFEFSRPFSGAYRITTIQLYDDFNYVSMGDISNVNTRDLSSTEKSVLVYNPYDYKWNPEKVSDFFETINLTENINNGINTYDQFNQSDKRNYIRDLQLIQAPAEITYAMNPERTGIKINGQLSSVEMLKFSFIAPAGNYKFSIGFDLSAYPSSSDSSDYTWINFDNTRPSNIFVSSPGVTVGNNGTECNLEILSLEAKTIVTLFLSDRTYSNLLIRPMLRLSTDSNSNYDSFVKSNYELQNQRELFSTNEQLIGSWVTGKNLYSKTYYYAYSSGTANTGGNETLFASADLDQIWIHDGFIIYNGNRYPIWDNDYMKFNITGSLPTYLSYTFKNSVANIQCYITIYYAYA